MTALKNCALEGVSVVLVGRFNPSIFQPAWFRKHALLPDLEADKAEPGLRVVHPEVTAFSADWLGLEVTLERFVASTSNPAQYEPLRDLVVGTFTLLEHTPISKLGLNRDMHFEMESERRWHDFGHFLAPKAPWTDILEDPGTRTLVIQGKRKESASQYVRVKVEPSVQPQAHPGVFIAVNEHFETKSETSTGGAEELREELQRSWAGFLDYSAGVSDHLLKQQF